MADGVIVLTDSASPVLWRLAPGRAVLEAWIESEEFFSLEGIAAAADGLVLVSDRTNGILRVDLSNRAVRRLEPPPEVTLLDIEGLVFVSAGRCYALQGGLRPARVLRLDLDPAAETIVAVQTVESGHMAMAAPSRGCLGPGGDLYYIGFAGRARFDAGEPAKPRSTPIFRTKLPAEKR
jgi:streptogramin lyase